MAKSSTLFYSIHNLASKIQHEIVEDDIFDANNHFHDVSEVLNYSPLHDVKQEIVDNIMQFADNY